MWELFSRGMRPYGNLPTTGEIVRQVCIDKIRLARLDMISEPVYKVMMWCWKEKPSDRPTFEEIEEKLVKLMRKSEQEQNSEVNQQPELEGQEETPSE